MCASDCSSEWVERELSDAFVLMDASKPLNVMRQGRASDFMSDAGVEDRTLRQQLVESLEAQERLRCELSRTLEANREEQAAQAKRIRELEAETCALRRALEEERGRIRLERAASGRVPARSGPPVEMLLRPLVLRSQEGEYLGVTDVHGIPLTLSGFMHLVERGGGPDRVVASCWEAEAGGWGLCFGVSSAGGCCSHVLRVRPMRTPSGNKVTVLAAMRVAGAPVPHAYLVGMFRQLRECFQEE